MGRCQPIPAITVEPEPVATPEPEPTIDPAEALAAKALEDAAAMRAWDELIEAEAAREAASGGP